MAKEKFFKEFNKMNINLKELSIRESERIEWKENGEDKYIVREIAKTIAAFANDIANVGGGYVVCGAKEGKDENGFPKVFYTGLTANKLKEIEGKVLQHCRDCIHPAVSPLVTELESPNDASKRVLVFTTLASPEAHIYRDKDISTYYVRISSQTREARNGILTQLLIKKQKAVYFDKRVQSLASEGDIDGILFRDYMHEMGLFSPQKPLEEYFSETEQIAEFVPPLFSRVGLDNTLRPLNFTLLLFGKKRSITRLFPEAYTVLSIYKGKDRSEPTAERHLLTGTLIEQARKAIELLNTQAYTAFDKLSDKPNQVKYPIRALKEAVINAVVHRDYEISDPNRITVFMDRIEVRSAGALHWAVDKEKFKTGKASPKWRNQSFAYLFNKMQLAQSEGQGIPTIIKTMREEGCPDPIFELGVESVTCILPAHPRHQLIRELQAIQDKIVLQNYEEARKQVLALLEEDSYNFRALDLLAEVVIKLKNPNPLFSFLTDREIDLYSINSETLLNIAEALTIANENKKIADFANKVLDTAISGRLVESQVLRAATSLKRLGKPDEAVRFITEAMTRYPKLSNNSSLLERRATSRIDIAKTCYNTGRDSKNRIKTRNRAVQMLKQQLFDAERDLNLALDNVENFNERENIERHFDFLNIMKEKAKRINRK